MKVRSVRRGMNGLDVKAVQEGLNKYHGSKLLNPDGDFGGNTDRIVRQFQRENKLTEDGEVGPTTRSVLFPLVGVTINFWAERRESSAFALTPPQLKLNPPFPPQIPGITPPLPPLTLNRPSLLGPPSLLDLSSVLGAMQIPPHNDFIQPAGLPDAVPVPKVATPPGGRITVEWQQISQTQRQFTRLFHNPQDSFALGWQSVFSRPRIDPNARHLEIATGWLIQSPIGFQDGHKNDFTLACFAQATWVESLGRSGNYQWAPYVQAQAQANTTGPLNALVQGGAFPLAFNLKLDPAGFDDVTLQLGAGVTGSLLFTPKGLQTTWGPQVGVGLQGKIWFLGR